MLPKEAGGEGEEGDGGGTGESIKPWRAHILQIEFISNFRVYLILQDQ